MSDHRIALRWQRNGAPFSRESYLRDHQIRFLGGQEIAGSSAADYGGNPAHTDPEQLLLAALSSCHFLTFLAVVANRGQVVEDYEDDAECELGKNAEGRMAVTRAVLRPRVRFGGATPPAADEVRRWHERAHQACFIANSTRTDVVLEPRFD
jgi:organic hydroperoxide reductase OsmC/OhrA